MATPAEVKKWFDGLDDDEQEVVKSAEDDTKTVKRMLVDADLIGHNATDGEVYDTLKMRH
jgi:hypothetical protein